jgi:hypothetical protein
MGLDVTHACWHGGYSSFNMWRRTVAKAAGLDFDNENQCAAMEPGPLRTLLMHSDCDGIIAAGECGPLADVLTALLPEIERLSPFPRGIPRNRAEDTEQFIAGLREAFAAGEDVEFR